MWNAYLRGWLVGVLFLHGERVSVMSVSQIILYSIQQFSMLVFGLFELVAELFFEKCNHTHSFVNATLF